MPPGWRYSRLLSAIYDMTRLSPYVSNQLTLACEAQPFRAFSSSSASLLCAPSKFGAFSSAQVGNVVFDGRHGVHQNLSLDAVV